MNLAWKLVIFTLLINISSGVMTNFIHIDNSITYDQSLSSAVDIYGVGSGGSNISNIQGLVQPTSYNWAANFLDILGLGFIYKIVTFFTTYLFSFPDMLMTILPDAAQGLKPLLITLITIAYTFAIISLFTHKNLNED